MKENIPIHNNLIEACKRNDHNAQSKIYSLYFKAMYNTSIRIIKNQQTAEDIMQESFLSAFRNIDSYSGEVTFGAWLKRIVINRSIDYVKKRKIEFTELKEVDTYIEDDTYSSNENSYSIDKIRNAIKDLADGYRIVLSLYLLEGYDHEEISEILNISASTSRSQYTRAKVKLIQILN